MLVVFKMLSHKTSRDKTMYYCNNTGWYVTIGGNSECSVCIKFQN